MKLRCGKRREYTELLLPVFNSVKNSVTISTHFTMMKDFSLAPESRELQNAIIQVKQGVLRGTRKKAALSGKPYYSFLGIPYAKPPLAELRFHPPQPANPWEGIYDATYEREPCVQHGGFLIVDYIGSEDCLHLNVFTPENPSEITTPKAVMVFFHGGGFSFGSGSKLIYSPDYLFQKDVLLVTVNNRLNILGFLNLDLPDCRGNAGMKDQVMALQWIKENIRNFGGDPNNITIFGQSAGASAVQYHTISPASKGLFHKAILHSGTSLSPWSMTYNPIKTAFQVGRKLGFQGEEREKLLEFFRKQSAMDLTRTTIQVETETKRHYPGRCLMRAFTVSVEKYEDGAFISDIPERLLKNTTPIPMMIGCNDKEAIYLLHEERILTAELFAEIRKDFSSVVKNNFKIEQSKLANITSEVTNFYFGDKKLEDIRKEDLVDLYTDILFFRLYDTIQSQLKSQLPTYIYQFKYDGQLNTMKRFSLSPGPPIKGASHADELGYLFFHEILPSQPKLNKDDLQMIENMVTLWTNFAKTGNPTDKMTNVKWSPATSNEMRYLSIDKDLQMIDGKVYGPRTDFWKKIMGSSEKPYDIFS